MTQNEQMLREALQRLFDAALNDWKGTPEQWKRESEALEKAEQALAAEPAPLVRLTQTERDRIAMSCQSTQQVISATIDAMVAKNGGQHVSD